MRSTHDYMDLVDDRLMVNQSLTRSYSHESTEIKSQ